MARPAAEELDGTGGDLRQQLGQRLRPGDLLAELRQVLQLATRRRVSS